jgi:bacteriocin biosynthesis cyclodehydratase domain-containing protein
VVDPVRATTVLASGVPHLSLVVREADVLVGPLVVPGRGPCLRCLELHRADTDPAWPALVARLTLDLVRAPRTATEVPVLAGVAAHLGAAVALAQLDGAPPTPGSTWSVALPDAVPRGRVWERHPQCGCAGPHRGERPGAPG